MRPNASKAIELVEKQTSEQFELKYICLQVSENRMQQWQQNSSELLLYR